MNVAQRSAPTGARPSRAYVIGMQLYAPAGFPLERILPHLGADRMACELRRARDHVAAALARAAAAFVQMEGWMPFGFIGPGDFAREALDRSGRWLRDLAALGRALGDLPGLEAALLGSDGGPPIGRVAATCIARVSREEDLAAWISLARSTTVRKLQQQIREARQSGITHPASQTGAPAVPNVDGSQPDPNGLRRVIQEEIEELDLCELRIRMPAPAATAFEEALELHRAVTGHQAHVASFVEALAAESSAGPVPPDVESARVGHDDIRRRSDKSVRIAEERLARETNHWALLGPVRPPDAPPPNRGEAPWDAALRFARRETTPPRVGGVEMEDVLARVRELAARDGNSDAAGLARQLRELTGLEEEIDRALGRLLHEMDVRRDWQYLRFTGLGHYAEQRLGISRRTAERRAGIFRALRPFPRLLEAYECGRIGLQAAWIIRRALGPGPVAPELEEIWIAQAVELTLKRMRDEARLAQLRRAGLVVEDGGAPAPSAPPFGMDPRRLATDTEWYASLRRDPGSTRQRIDLLGRRALDPSCDTVFLRLRVEEDVASAFLAAIETMRQDLTQRAARGLEIGAAMRTSPAAEGREQSSSSIAEDLEPRSSAFAPRIELASMVAARVLWRRTGEVPSWVALMAMLEDYVQVWDDPKSFPRREWEETYRRAGWRCEAPGCTARCRIEDHHILYRSRNGSNDPWNQLCLCRRHHKLGEHGGMARCRGTAPLDVTWRLGREDLGTWYRNERRIAAPERSHQPRGCV